MPSSYSSYDEHKPDQLYHASATEQQESLLCSTHLNKTYYGYVQLLKADPHENLLVVIDSAAQLPATPDMPAVRH